MHAASLPRRAQHSADRGLQALMRVGDDQPGAAQAAAEQALQERGSEDLCLRGADMQAHDLPFALCDHRHRPDLPTLALLKVGRVQPEIGLVANERALDEGVHPVVDVLVLLLIPLNPIACTRSSTRLVDTPPIQASWITATRAFSDVLRGSRNGGTWAAKRTEAALAQLGDPELQVTQPGIQRPVPEAVAVRCPLGRCARAARGRSGRPHPSPSATAPRPPQHCDRCLH